MNRRAFLPFLIASMAARPTGAQIVQSVLLDDYNFLHLDNCWICGPLIAHEGDVGVVKDSYGVPRAFRITGRFIPQHLGR